MNPGCRFRALPLASCMLWSASHESVTSERRDRGCRLRRQVQRGGERTRDSRLRDRRGRPQEEWGGAAGPTVAIREKSLQRLGTEAREGAAQRVARPSHGESPKNLGKQGWGNGLAWGSIQAREPPTLSRLAQPGSSRYTSAWPQSRGEADVWARLPRDPAQAGSGSETACDTVRPL